MSLRLRLYVVAAILLSVVSVLGVLLVRSVENSELRQIDQQLRTAIPVVGSIDRALPAGSPRFPPPSGPPSSTSRISAFYVAAIVDGHRKVLVTPLDAKGESPDVPGTFSMPKSDVKIATVGSVSGSERWRAFVISSPTDHSGLLVAASLGQLDATASRLRLTLLAAGAVLLAVLLAAGFWVSRLGLRPIAEVTDVAVAISEGDRSRRAASVRQGTEAGNLARAFNVMLDELQAQEDRLRRFVADASHELRTPVSVILGVADLWRQGELRNGPAGDDAMRRIGQSGRQMGRLVEDLLLLAHLDERRPMHRAPVDLGTLIRDAVLDARATDPLRHIEVQVAGSVMVMGDESALRQVVSNLVTNSLRHTPPEATITIRACAAHGEALLDVIDSGPGMSETETQKAFDRFWRADMSRSRPGTGLGLPIVAGIVAAHQGSVTLESNTTRGTTLSVRIPLGRIPESNHARRD